MKFSEIEDLFDWVGSAALGEHCAYLHRRTGESYITTELGDSEEVPDDLDDNDDYLFIPHPNDLDLGQRLVFDFVAARLPDDYDRVRGYFSRRGAYTRLKDLLSTRGLLDDWYEHEARHQREAILEWCEENGVVIEE